jgi:hypothetical protein
MATEFTNSTDIAKQTFFTDGNVVTGSHLNNISYFANLKNIRGLIKSLSYDGVDRIGVLNGFDIEPSSVGMTATIAPGMIISTNDNTTIYNADHYVLASLDATDSITITAASANPRVDLICARPAEQYGTQVTMSYRDTDGNLATRSSYPDISCPVTLVHIMGTPGADPTPASPQYDYDIPLYYIFVPTTATAADDCTIHNIMPYYRKKAEAIVKIAVDIDAGVINSATESSSNLDPNLRVYGVAKATDDTILLYCVFPDEYFDEDSLDISFSTFGMSGTREWPEIGTLSISDGGTASATKGMRKINLVIGYCDATGPVTPTSDHTLTVKLSLVSDSARPF